MKKHAYELYLKDLIYYLQELAFESKRQKEESRDKEENLPYYLGKLMAYYEVIDLLIQQASTFEISLKELSLDDIDPEKDLLGL